MFEIFRSIPLSFVMLVVKALVFYVQNSPEGVQEIDAVIGDLLDDGELNGSNQQQTSSQPDQGATTDQGAQPRVARVRRVAKE